MDDNVTLDLIRAHGIVQSIELNTEHLRTTLKRICFNHPTYRNRKPAQMNVEQLQTLVRRIAKFESTARKVYLFDDNSGVLTKPRGRTIGVRRDLKAQN